MKVHHFRHLLAGMEMDFADKDVLEAGAAEGYGVTAMNDLWPTARVTALESNPESTTYYTDLDCTFLAVDLERFLHMDSEGFDTIFLFDVLEHLRDPKTTLTQLAQTHLRPGGKIAATFPNVDSLWHSLLGRWWFQYKVEHLFYFSRQAVALLAQAAGLKIMALRPLTKRLPLGYVLSVGANFGPAPGKAITRCVAGILPERLHRLVLPLRFSELLFVAEKS